MRRINILYVITKLELGGAQKQLLSLVSGLDKKKHNIFLFTAKNGPLFSNILSIKELSIRRSVFLERSINPLKDLFALIEIWLYIKKNNIDIVHTHSSKAGILGRIAAKLAGCKAIFHTVHGWSFNDYQPALLKRLFMALERWTAGFTDKLVVVSDYDKKKGLENNIGVKDKYAVIRYGINHSEFMAQDHDFRKQPLLNSDDLKVSMIACFKPQKAPLDFVKLAGLVSNAVPDVKFILIGDGALRKKIEALIFKLNLNSKITLLGWRSDIPYLLSQTDVFVLTSLWEGMPISVLEAMSASVPVIATDTGGIREVIRDNETGFLVKPGDMKKMSEQLIVLLRDAALRRQIAKEAKDSIADRFTLEDMVKFTEGIYAD